MPGSWGGIFSITSWYAHRGQGERGAMRQVYFRGAGGIRIPIQVKEQEGATLLECHEPATLLPYLVQCSEPLTLAPDTYLRGVITPGVGAQFQLFDSLGTISHDVLTIGDKEADALVRNLW
jgi:hypothetical protein